MWSIIIISLWWSLDFFIISHFLPKPQFPILAHEVPLIFFLMQVVNIFIIHHKSWILHIAVWTLITLTTTVYDIFNLYCFIISMCISSKSTCIFTFGQYPSNQDLSSTTNCGASISSKLSYSCSTCLTQMIFWLWLVYLNIILLFLLLIVLLPSLNL